MKKFITFIMALVVVAAFAACTEPKETEKPVTPDIENEQDAVGEDVTNEGDTQTTPETDETPSADENKPSGNIPEGLEEISYEAFKELISYSMIPYEIPVNVEKNITHSISGYNGTVELTYFSFVMKANAEKYFDEVKSTFPGNVVEHTEQGDYELCKFEDGEYYYMMARINETIVYGSCKSGYEPINDWFYGLGYVTK